MKCTCKYDNTLLLSTYSDMYGNVWFNIYQPHRHCNITTLVNTLYCYRIQNSTSIPPQTYVFPNGYNLGLTVDRFKLTEALFDASSHNLKVLATTHNILETLS